LLNRNMIFRNLAEDRSQSGGGQHFELGDGCWRAGISVDLRRVPGKSGVPDDYFERLASVSRNRASNDPAFSPLPARFLTTLANAFSATARW
jgi:hypothetical protein